MPRYVSGAVLLLTLALSTAGAATPFALTVEGKPAATILLPREPLPVVQAAASELQYHVRLASGAELPIAREGQGQVSGPVVALGATAAAAALGLSPLGLPPNACLLRAAAGNLYLCGDDSPGEPFWVQHGNRTHVGTLLAVYELLDKQLGVRWLWPGPLGELVPRRASVTLQVSDQTLTPRFIHTRWRDGGQYSAGARGWASQETRSRFLNEQGKWLRRHRFAMGLNMDMAHSYTDWWERFGKDHPEYFNLLPDGTRRSDPAYHGGAPSLISMCVGEPGVRRQKVADWAARRSPEAPYLDASENDTPGKCTCALCLALDETDPGQPRTNAQRLAAAREAFAAGKPDWVDALGSLSDRYARFYLALQQEAEKTDPQAVVMGYAYANYVKPPLQTRLNPRVIIGVVPALMYPWTAEKRRAFVEQWEGWSAAGARLFLRPNYMLDGHCLPVNIALPLGEDFSYAAHHGLIGTDFDSLTGQYATQGPNLYMLARLHEAPELTPARVLDEYYAAFGPAAAAVRAYFDHWAEVSAAVTDEQYAAADLHWSRFYRDADTIFTPAVMARGAELLRRAAAAAQGDAPAAARVRFLNEGLRNAELVLATQRAFREYRQRGDLETYTAALAELDAFRASCEGDLVANMAYLAWSESLTWDRDLLKLLSQPGRRLPDPWQFAFDPDAAGEQGRWFAEGYDASGWAAVNTVQTWEAQEPGLQWKARHGQDYDGLAWYRTSFQLDAAAKEGPVRLVFGAVDEACKVWLNGQLLLERPYPYQGDTDSWRQAFEVDLTAAVRRDKPNLLAVQVQDKTGAGGIFKPVWLVVTEPPAPPQSNLLRDGGFEAEPPAWGQNVQCGRFQFRRDAAQAHSGTASGLVRCEQLAPTEAQGPAGLRAWGRWYQAPVTVDPQQTYRCRAWYRTPASFGGTIKLWVTGTKGGTQQAQAPGSGGIWRELRLPEIHPAAATVGVYLNVTDATGEVWFDDVELVAR